MPIAAGSILIVGILGLIGWALEVAVLRSVVPGLPPMSPGSALGFVLAGLALWSFSAQRTGIARVFAAAVTLLGLVMLSGEGHWVLSSFNFFLFGLALLLLARKEWPIDLLVVIPTEIALLGAIGYVCTVPAFYGEMALPSVAGFIALGVGILWSRPNGALTTVLQSATAGGVAARRLLLAPVLISIALRLLRNATRSLGYFDPVIGGWLFSLPPLPPTLACSGGSRPCCTGWSCGGSSQSKKSSV